MYRSYPALLMTPRKQTLLDLSITSLRFDMPGEAQQIAPQTLMGRLKLLITV
jgi:hypothetical protein